MPISTTYTITNTQGSLTFQMTAGSANGPNELAQGTDLTFYGYGRTGWGQQVDQNFYSLLENFACNALPGPIPSTKSQLGGTLGINHPVIGQQWFNLSNSEMYVCTDATLNTWNHLISEPYADTKYLTISDASGTGTNAFLKLNGSNSPMTGPLLLNADPTGASNPSTAATKNYVDTAISTLTGILTAGYVQIAGDTMTGALRLTTATATDAFTDISVTGANTHPLIQMGRLNGIATTAEFDFYTSGSTVGSPTVDASIVASSGVVGNPGQGTLTLTGFVLSDGRTPTLANQFTNKNYVDTLIADSIAAAILGINNSTANLYLPLTGGTMTGIINMNTRRITNLPTPAAATDPATMGWTQSNAYGVSGQGFAHQVWVSTAAPSGGQDGDIWIRY